MKTAEHPLVATLLQRFGWKSGSARKAVLKALAEHTSLFETNEGHGHGQSFYSFVQRSKRFSATERDRRRAKKDKVFRARLRKAIIPVNVRSIKSVDQYISEYTHRLNLQISLGLHGVVKKLPANVSYLPCGEEEARHLDITVVRRGKDWTVKGAEKTYHYNSPGETTWKNGRAVAYSRATNITYIRALALIQNSRKLVCALGNQIIRVILPEDMIWNIDANGLRVVRGQDDYHPEGIDFLGINPVERLINKLNENKEKRRQTELQQLAEKADNEGIYVCLADSVRAGNCRAGSINFATRHNLNIAKHYPALELLSQANGDGRYVRLAITAAKIRHRREMERGYGFLAEHGI